MQMSDPGNLGTQMDDLWVIANRSAMKAVTGFRKPAQTGSKADVAASKDAWGVFICRRVLMRSGIPHLRSNFPCLQHASLPMG